MPDKNHDPHPFFLGLNQITLPPYLSSLKSLPKLKDPCYKPPILNEDIPVLFVYPPLSSSEYSSNVDCIFVQVLLTTSKYPHRIIFTAQNLLSPSLTLPLLMKPDQSLLYHEDLKEFAISKILEPLCVTESYALTQLLNTKLLPFIEYMSFCTPKGYKTISSSWEDSTPWPLNYITSTVHSRTIKNRYGTVDPKVIEIEADHCLSIIARKFKGDYFYGTEICVLDYLICGYLECLSNLEQETKMSELTLLVLKYKPLFKSYLGSI